MSPDKQLWQCGHVNKDNQSHEIQENQTYQWMQVVKYTKEIPVVKHTNEVQVIKCIFRQSWEYLRNQPGKTSNAF